MSNSITDTKVSLRYPWMFGKQIDVGFFFLPVLLGFLLYFLTLAPQEHAPIFWSFMVANALGAGPFHQGATWFAYLDAKNRNHFKSNTKKRAIFFLGPPVVLFLTILGSIYAFQVTLAIWMIWSLQHLVQQNVGILLLYHNHGKGEAIVPRPIEAKTQQSAAIMFALIFFYRVMLKYTLSAVMIPLIVVASIFCLIMIGQYLIQLNKQIKAGSYLNVPAFAFWALSTLSLWPLAFLGRSFEDGYLIPITVHWFQYIGLNYVLVRNKYKTEELGQLPIAKPVAMFVVLCLGVVAVNFSLSASQGIFTNGSIWKGVIVGTILGLGNVHYFLDAFLWRFREPYQRQAILPYLIAGR